jgi:hypothetical protein
MVREGTGTSARKGIGEGVPRKVELPDRGIKMAPRFLTGESPTFAPNDPYRPTFAAWATSPTNPFFARCMTNRMWAQFFGRGLVNPLDDVRPDNEQCTHPELLQKLTDAFVASGFDLKFLARAICGSQTYQRTSKPAPGVKEGDKLYGRMAVRVQTPQQLLNSLTALGVLKTQGSRGKNGTRAFLNEFSVDGEEFDPLQYERGIPSLLRLANSPAFEKGRQDLARALAADAKSPARFVEQAYLRILARRPTPDETRQMNAHIQKLGVPRGHDDVVWVLLNSSEFTLIR